MKDFSICIAMDCWKLARGGLFLDTEEEEESVITHPHLRILPITSAHNPRNISPQFTRLNIHSSAFYRRPYWYSSRGPLHLFLACVAGACRFDNITAGVDVDLTPPTGGPVGHSYR